MTIFRFSSAPRRAVAWCALVALSLSALTPFAWALELRPTKDFRDVAAAVERFADQYGPEHVLLVLDIDNTLMSMNNDLGSDHWFEWQSYLLKHEPDSPYLVADTFDGLLDVQGILYNLGHMHPPQPDLPEIIQGVQKRGISTIILTSRGPEFRVATERELKRNGYDLAANALQVRGVPGGTYLAYDPEDPESDGLLPKEVRLLDLKDPRPVSYENGVFMTAGQHKGIMLLTLLHHAKPEIKAIVYADDNVRHVGNVFSSAVDRNLDAAVFQYQREDPIVQRFNYGSKDDVTRRWHRLRDTLQSVFD